MSYRKERDEFINRATLEGLELPVILKLLRYATTLQRLAEAQCNGDWPADNGERKVKPCPRCEAGFVPSVFRTSDKRVPRGTNGAERYNAHNTKLECAVKVCPDCRTTELVSQLLPPEFKAHTNGDPRGAVLRLSTPGYPWDECGKNGAYGLYVPARER